MTKPRRVRAHLTVRLSDAEISAISTIIQAMSVPNREAPTVAEAVRLAILRAAEALTGAAAGKAL